MSPPSDGSPPLEGIRILDLADETASFCSKLMADLGGCVVKVERPGGDPARRIGPFRKGPSDSTESLSFFYHNTSKLGITLDIDHPDGRDLFLRLVERSDVVVETFSPGYLDHRRLGFEVLKAVNPRVILVSVTGFGQTGPRRHWKSCDLVAAAFGGQMFVSGLPSTPPLRAFGNQSHYAASLLGAMGVLLALRQRNGTGRGAHLDISLQEAVAATLEHVLIRYAHERIVSSRQGTLHWNRAFEVFPCRDGFVHLSLFHQWETLVEWIATEGMAEDLGDEKWLDEAYRLRHLDHVIDVLSRWTIRHTRRELFELGQLMGFPWAPVSSPADVVSSPQLAARDFFQDVEPSLRSPGPPFRSSEPLTACPRRPPRPGEHNVQIYQGELGLDDEEMATLRANRVI